MTVAAWIRAARLPSQVNIAPPILLGQVLAWRAAGDDAALRSTTVAAFMFGLFVQLSIVFANDVADVETDTRNATATPFSGGSRVLVDAMLDPRQLATGAVATAIASLMVSAWLGPVPLALAFMALILLWLYSGRPARVAYRGGGELLQTIGVGGVLPLFGWAAHGAVLSSFPWVILAAHVPLQFATAVATALPDEPSDRASCKRTLPVVIGPGAAGIVIAVAHGTGLAFLVCWLDEDVSSPLVILAIAAAAVQLLLIRARPGTRAMLVRVFCAMLATLTASLALVWAAWPE